MNDNIPLSSTIQYSNSKDNFFNHTLDTTSDKIGSHFNNLFNRSEEIENVRKNSSSIVQRIAEREASVAKYAQQLVEFKNQFEKDQQDFESQMRNQQESIENVIIEVSKKLAEIQTISVEISNKLTKYSQEKSSIKQKIDDLHGMDDDLLKEEKEINDRVAKLEQNIKENEPTSTKLDIKKVNEDIIATDVIIDELQNKINDISKTHQKIQNHNQIAKQKVQKIDNKLSKAKNSSDINLLKKSLNAQTEKFKLYDDQQKENEKKLKEMKESIQKSNDRMAQMTENQKEFKKKAEHRQNLFGLDKNQIEDAKKDVCEMYKIIKIMKKCKTMKEFQILKKILETKDEKDEVLRKIGEIHMKKKIDTKKIPEINVKLQNYERKIDESNKITDLIQDVNSKIKSKEQIMKNDSKNESKKIESAIGTLEQINQHIAFSEKVGDDLSSHKFINYVPNDELVNKYSDNQFKLQKKIDQILKEIKKIQKQIKNLTFINHEHKDLINCPAFPHRTKINFRNKDFHHDEKISQDNKNPTISSKNNQIDNKNCCTIEKMQSLVYFRQKNIQKRRFALIERKKRLQNVCDFYNNPKFSKYSLDEIMFCNCIVKLYHGKRIRSYDEIFQKILIEKEKWENVPYGTPPMLVAWYDLIDNIF